MSWELTSFLILGAVLVAGFAWYERSRPPSQVVALVAALAALAIAGRIAFAAFPNVKPTTDIVIFAGYALGPAPGFAVGALTALVSNLWFGQGPWTPWQMAGWGLCGILGAALALGVRNAGRLSLAATCGFAGIAYGALLNFSLMATYGGDLSLERFGVLQVRALPFDLAHAAGNVAFALIAGPAMVRMLARFRERFEWGRGEPSAAPAGGGLSPGLRAGGVAALLLVALVLGALAPTPAGADVDQAAQWLRTAQNSDGGFGTAPDEDSGAEMTAWAMLGLEAAGDNPLDVARVGRTPVDFLRGHTGELRSPGDLARTIVALEGAGVDPRDFGGVNLVSQLLAKRRDNGSYEGWPGSTAFAVIALRAAGATGSLEQSLSWLQKVQNDDGGWGDVPGSPSTPDGTGAVMQALSSGAKAVQRGLSYLRGAQRQGGGFPLGGNSAVNTQSTAWAVQGIIAAGGDPDSFRRGGSSAPEYLAAQQAGDGHYLYSESRGQTPVWVTGQVLVAAAGKSLPIPPPPREPKPAQPNTGGIPPSSIAPPSNAIPLPSGVPGGGANSASPGGSANGGGGPLPNVLRPPG
jgi:energy-coupling factor transport system substrate-specific component